MTRHDARATRTLLALLAGASALGVHQTLAGGLRG